MFDPEVEAAVQAIVAEVQARGDEAVLAFTERFDGVRPEPMKVPLEALAHAFEAVDPDLRRIIAEAAAHNRRFH